MKNIQTQSYISKMAKKQPKNEYAICTDSIGEKEGTTERSEWSDDAKARYDRCLKHINPGEHKKSNSRYENVVFMQGNEAKLVLAILNAKGKDAALDHLKQWHHPGEHQIDAKLAHNDSDQTYSRGDYHMAWNEDLGYIDLKHGTEMVEPIARSLPYV